MGTGGGTQNVNQTTTSIPKEFYPYFNRMLARGEEASLQPYQPYSGQRLADQNQDINQSYSMIRNMAGQGQPGIDQAMDVTRSSIGQIGNIMGQGPYQFSQYGYSDPGQFSGQAISQYMSPYMQDVVNGQKRAAAEEFQIANAARNAQAVQAGAFGGSRQAVQQGMAERDLMSRLGDIQSQGLQKSYEDAQSMFEKDRAARFAAEQAQAAELSRVQSGQSAENYNRSNLNLNALTLAGNQANQLADLQQKARAGDVQAAQLLETVGKSQQAQEQAKYDLGYQDYLRQQGYTNEQLQNLSAMLHGLPIQATGTTTTSVPYNPLQQALGTGIAALGLYKGLA